VELWRECKAAVSRMPRCHRAGVKSGRSKAPPCGHIAVAGFLLPVSRNTCDDAVLGIGESCIISLVPCSSAVTSGSLGSALVAVMLKKY
jgi:hypothetical protein